MSITPLHNLSTLAKNMKKNSYTIEDTRDIITSTHICQKHTQKNLKLPQTCEKFKKCTFTINTSSIKYQINLNIICDTKNFLGPCLTHVQNSHVDFSIMAFVLTKCKVLALGLLHFMDNFIVNHIFKGNAFQQTSKITD
jgi:hypothetical protein